MATLSGGCLCGNVRYVISGEINPYIQFTCHCRDCQQVTGAGHARSMGVDKSQVSWSSAPKVYQLQHENSVVDSAFCGDCGAPMYKATTGMPDFVFFHLGSLDLDAPHHWSSKQTAYGESRQSWDVLDSPE